jgi:hypothetical protein
MMSEIQAGEGWRLLGDEPVQALADECYWPSDKTWHPISPMYNLLKASTFVAVRRRIPAKPDVLKIQSEGGLKGWMRKDNTLVLEQKDDSGGFECVLIWETKSIRQVIAWLQQVADWREAQESK